MSNNKTTNAEAPKALRKYAKTRGEHYKDIVIAILVTAVIAFVGGTAFANKQQAEVKSAVKSATQALAPKTQAATQVK